MQKHSILITLSGDTNNTSINSSMNIVNDYEVNLMQGLGGGVVNYSNVRGFLNDKSNSNIINDFYSYLTGNTDSLEFYEIYNSDQKLSNVFNNYYQSSIVDNQYPPTDVIDNSLSGTVKFVAIDKSIYNFNGVAPSKYLESIPLSINNSTRIVKSFSALTTFIYEPSYYIPVFIKRNYNQTERERVYFDNIMQQINDFTPGDNEESGGGNGDYGYHDNNEEYNNDSQEYKN